jgi:hypothetical protein
MRIRRPRGISLIAFSTVVILDAYVCCQSYLKPLIAITLVPIGPAEVLTTVREKLMKSVRNLAYLAPGTGPVGSRRRHTARGPRLRFS